MTGQRITYEVSTPLEYGLHPSYPGELLPFYKSAAPLMHERLLDVITRAGADNLQLFDAVLDDPQRSIRHTDYKAVNVIGLVAIADLAKSQTMGTSDSERIDVDFHRLVMREQIPGEHLIFRMAESVNAIVVHERIKQRIDAAAVPGMTFYASGEWSG
ncbi:imm11 family protein [Povalibacter sp.]|uniref:imm11 family protein n=1 Tax=Povalibacter sp. TaxID=1962978 RepID=UPI002F3E551E